ncbi:MAG: O-antigen ligase family protein [Chloroflexota bacterium]
MSDVAASTTPPTAISAPPGIQGGFARALTRLVRAISVTEIVTAPVAALVLLIAPDSYGLVAGMVAAVPVLTRLLATGRLWLRTPFDTPIALIVAGACLGWIAGLDFTGATLRFGGLIASLLLYAAVLEHARTPRRLRTLTVAVTVALLVAAAFVVVSVSEFLRVDRVPGLAAAINRIDAGGTLRLVAADDYFLQMYRLRASGVGAIGVAGLAVAAAWILTLGRTRWRLLTLLYAVIMALVVFVSDNRGSMLAAVMSVSAVAVTWRPVLLPIIPVGLAGMVGLIASGLVERGMNFRTIGQRFWFWESSLYLAREVPMTGAGLGTESVQLTYKAYFAPVYPPFSHAHNIYLQALLEQGVLGLLGYGLLGIALLVLAWRIRSITDYRAQTAALAGTGVTAAMLTAGLSEIVALTTVGSVLLFVGMGLLAAASHTGVQAPASANARTAWRSRCQSVIRTARAQPRVALVATGAVLVALLVSGLPRMMLVGAMLNVGTVQLNRVTISEDTSRPQRQAAMMSAVWWLSNAASLWETNAVVQRNLALALAAQPDIRRARIAADRARDATPPSDALGQFQVGRAYVAVAGWAEAIRAWERAGAAPQLLQLGNRIIRVRNWDQAIAAYTAAANLQPNSRGAYEGIAKAIIERDGGMERLGQVLQPLIDKGGARATYARLQLARSYREAGAVAESLSVIGRLETANPSPELVLERGLTLLALGRTHDANPDLSRSVELYPGDSATIFALASARAGMGYCNDAIALARAGISRLDPTNRTVARGPGYAVIGDCLAMIGEVDEARANLAEGLRVTPGDPHLADSLRHLDARKVGNHIFNPSFEWSGFWRSEPDGTPSVRIEVETGVPDGQRALRVVTLGTRPTYAAQFAGHLEPGQRYRFTVSSRSEGPSADAATVSVLNLEGNPLVVAAAAQSAQWELTTLDFVAPGPAVTIVMGFRESSRGGIAIFDNATLTRQ